MVGVGPETNQTEEVYKSKVLTGVEEDFKVIGDMIEREEMRLKTPA